MLTNAWNNSWTGISCQDSRMDYIIREEQPQDVEQVRFLMRAAFSTEAESKLVDTLRSNGKAIISLVGVCGEDVLGHILFSPVTTSPPGEAKGIGLAPVAVLPSVQSQGIGSNLILAGLQLCRSFGYDFCVVLGSPEYYQRFGFEAAQEYGLENEYGAGEEFMVLHFTDQVAAGLVQYAPEFALFSL
jgi:putative acetyltransferase